MAKAHPEPSGNFEFIQTPPALTPTPAEDCGVRTTNVSNAATATQFRPVLSSDSLLSMVTVPSY